MTHLVIPIDFVYGASVIHLRLTALMFLLSATSALADTVPGSPMIWVNPPQFQREESAAMKALKDSANTLSEVVGYFMRGIMPDKTGMDWPNPNENRIDQYAFRLGNSRFFFYVQGSGTLKLVHEELFFNHFQGGAGVQYSLTDPKDPSLSVVIRLSPLYGEIVSMRTGNGAAPIDDLPSQMLLGGSAGLEVSNTTGPVETGLRFYARAHRDTANGRNTGVAMYHAAYLKLRIDEILKIKTGYPVTLNTYLEYYDRGDALGPMYEYGADRYPRTVADIRRFWEFMSVLEVRFK